MEEEERGNQGNKCERKGECVGGWGGNDLQVHSFVTAF